MTKKKITDQTLIDAFALGYRKFGLNKMPDVVLRDWTPEAIEELMEEEEEITRQFKKRGWI